MEIGVVCEGPSDFPAIEHFIGTLLKSEGFTPNFRALFPVMDNTRPDGGWAQVFTWISNNPDRPRTARFFGGGLFGGTLAEKPLDTIIFHLDTDILGESSFVKYVKDKFNLAVGSPTNLSERSEAVKKVLRSALNFKEMVDSVALKHVLFPAVESTEAWCVAVFSGKPPGSEKLQGAALVNAFMIALETSESKTPEISYENVDKTRRRREKFCRNQCVTSSRLLRDCAEFNRSYQDVLSIAKKL